MDKITKERELELIDGMIEVQLHHATQCDGIANRKMAEKQKGWDMERVALLRKMRAALLAAQQAEAQREPVAWRHSKTGQLYDLEEEVPLADGDEWAEPLYAAPVAQQEPSAWRQWSTKQHDWDYQTNRGDLRPDTHADPLFVAAAQPEAIEQALQKIADFGQEQEPVAWLRIQEHENRPTTIHLCDSDHPKAFKVYATRPQPASSQAKSLALFFSHQRST